MNTKLIKGLALTALIACTQTSLAATTCTLTGLSVGSNNNFFNSKIGAQVNCGGTNVTLSRPSSQVQRLDFSDPVTDNRPGTGTARYAICSTSPGAGNVEWTISKDKHSATCVWSSDW